MERTSMHHAVTDGSEGIDRRSYCRQLCLNRRWQGFLVLLKKIVGIGEIRVIEKVLQTRGAACPVSIVLVTGLDPRQQVSVAYENVWNRHLRPQAVEDESPEVLLERRKNRKQSEPRNAI